MRFTPTRDFYEAELGSAYVKDLQYIIRPGDNKLRAFAKRWLAEGKIVVLDGAVPPSKIMGTGSVS